MLLYHKGYASISYLISSKSNSLLRDLLFVYEMPRIHRKSKFLSLCVRCYRHLNVAERVYAIVYLSVCLDGWRSRIYCSFLRNHMSKGNEGNRSERQLAALAKQTLRTSVYILYTLLVNPCLEKRCVIYHAQ